MPIKSEPIIIYVIVLSDDIIGIGENTDRIVSSISDALSIIATPVWFPIVMLLLTISLGLIVVGKLSIIGFTVFSIIGFIIGFTGAIILFKFGSLIIVLTIRLPDEQIWLATKS